MKQFYNRKASKQASKQEYYNKLSKFVCILLCVIFLFNICTRQALADDNKVVKTAWYSDSYHILGENGEKSGYGYEYEQAVSAYTGWDYDYVEGDWSELLHKLENGEIDLMAALSYTDERADKMLFSELPMGEEKYYLYVDLNNTDISTSDLTTLNNKRIVVMKDSVQATQFYEWEEKQEIKTQYVYLDF